MDENAYESVSKASLIEVISQSQSIPSSSLKGTSVNSTSSSSAISYPSALKGLNSKSNQMFEILR